jgi:2-polyprenyl-3-methyl-5-hydroxy-6-metoxy-1,4-benzoquinol methylase
MSASDSISTRPNVVVDPTYGYRRLDPLPTESEFERFYQSEYYDLLRKGGRAPELRRLLAGGEKGEQERAWLRETLYADITAALREHGSGNRVLDIGCGQGELVRLLLADGFDAWGVDISPEQVALAQSAGLDRAVHGDFHAYLRARAGEWDAVVATDVLEHLARAELLATFDDVRQALRPSGLFVARVPNAVSPMGGHTMFGDVTHETWFTRRSVAQLAAVAGFSGIAVHACPPAVHGPASAARAVLWRLVSGLLKLALATETGQLRDHIVTQNLTFVARR